MSCGKYKNDLFRQTLVNESVIETQVEINQQLNLPKKKGNPGWDKAKLMMYRLLKKNELKIKFK